MVVVVLRAWAGGVGAIRVYVDDIRLHPRHGHHFPVKPRDDVRRQLHRLKAPEVAHHPVQRGGEGRAGWWAAIGTRAADDGDAEGEGEAQAMSLSVSRSGGAELGPELVLQVAAEITKQLRVNGATGDLEITMTVSGTGKSAKKKSNNRRRKRRRR